MKSPYVVTLVGVASVVLAVIAPGPVRSDETQPVNVPSGDAVDAKQLFATSCGWCHQNGGRSPGRGPKLAGNQHTDEYLMNRIKTGKEGAMPAFGSMFSEPQLRALVGYIRTLKEQ
jgi:mono/diheme cytochrome c family protein